MANTGQTKGSMVAAIQSAQMAVGSSIAGGAGAISSPADMEQTSILDRIKEISQDTKESIESMAKTMADQFVFDKDKFRREMDARREAEKERLRAMGDSSQAIQLPTKEEATGGFGKLALGGIAAVAAFAEALNVDAILRLPQQLKSIKAMATFAKGVGTISTLGFGPAIVDRMKASIKSISLKPSEIKIVNEDLLKRFKDMFRPVTNLFERMRLQFRLFTMELRAPIDKLKDITRSVQKTIDPIIDGIKSAFARVRAVLKPITDTIKGLFGSGTGVVSKMIEPLKTLGKTIGRLFLPVTLILGVIDGVKGFMDEYGETGSIVDGIRGAVTGIIDGFIGGLVRLVGSAIEYIFSFLGLDNLGASINEKINLLMDNFLQAIGGITDIITGLFTFDGERIMSGLGAMFSGVGGFFLNLLSAPIDMAVNFMKDIFGFGDPEKPFSLKDWLLGSLNSVWEWVKSLFTFDFSSIGNSLFNIGTMMKALAAGGLAAAGAMLPGGESPGEAFSRKYNEVMSSGNDSGEIVNEGDNISRITTENSNGDVTTTTYKTNTINQAPPGMAPVTIVNNQPTNISNQQSSSSNSINAVNLDTSTDSYWDRLSVAG